MDFKSIYYEPDITSYPLGKQLMERYQSAQWIPIENHNNIEQLRKRPNADFADMKRLLIVGTRKTHVYRPNKKVSDFLVPFTSSGCTASCLYCYLVCNYNKCSYLRLFVNREQMLDKLMRFSQKSDMDYTFEIGSNSDLVLEQTITENLSFVIPRFSKLEKGYLTFPTKFSMVEPLLVLDHRKRVIVRMSVNPEKIISEIERGTSSLKARVGALNKLCDAGYKVGLLIAPIVLVEGWKELYRKLIEQLADTLSEKAKRNLFIEIIFMTYSYIHRAINNDAFPGAVELYDKSIMTGRGRGKYTYRPEIRADGEQFLREQLEKFFPDSQIVYVV